MIKLIVLCMLLTGCTGKIYQADPCWSFGVYDDNCQKRAF